MKVSVVTISYNQASYLEACLRSVIDQDYHDLEYIVVDALSTDSSHEILSRYKGQIDRLIIEKDNGPADGLNKGFMNATGEILCYLNADDVLVPGAIEFIVTYFKNNPEIDLAYGDCEVIDAQGNLTSHRISTPRFSSYKYLIGCTSVCQPSTFFRKRVFEKTSGFNVKNRTCWDGELLLDLTRVGARMSRVGRYLSRFRLHDESISGSRSLERQFVEYKSRLMKENLGRGLQLHDRIFILWCKLEHRLIRICKLV